MTSAPEVAQINDTGALSDQVKRRPQVLLGRTIDGPLRAELAQMLKLGLDAQQRCQTA